LILFFIFCIQASAWAGSTCSEINNDCEYYSCVAETKHCSKSSYLLRFGQRYCLRYNERRSAFSASGIKWIEDVRSCLIRRMSFYESILSCRDLKSQAFMDHIPCYLESGFCDLSKSDRFQVLKTIWPSLGHFKILANGYEVFKTCSNTK